MMSGHDIDSILEDGLSPLTHIAHKTPEDYNFIALQQNSLIQVTFKISLDPSVPPRLFDLNIHIENIWGEELAPDITTRAEMR